MSVSHWAKSRMPGFLRLALRTGQRFGVNITPNHFYSDIPDFRHLRKTDYWRQPSSMFAVPGADVDAQLAFVRDCCAGQAGNFQTDQLYREACRANGEAGYGPIEALFLHAFIQRHRPARVLQIGCGVSTAIIDGAARSVPDYVPAIRCVEPYPTPLLRRLDQERRIELIPRMAQLVEQSLLTDLDAGDLLFIDSTHTVKVGSEVVRLITEILPRLRPGVWVHFHDIYFPYDFFPGFLKRAIFFWRETTLLYAYLLHNSTITIRASLSMMHHHRQDELRQMIPAYQPSKVEGGLEIAPGHFPSSIYLQTVRHAAG